jgi:hypothetical protein
MSLDLNAGLNHNIETENRSGERVQIFWNNLFGNNLNKSKSYPGRNEEQIEVRECLLSFGAGSLVFQFAIQKFKYTYIQNYNFACFIVWIEIWAFTLREKLRLSVLKNRMLRRIFVPKGTS